ncbi:MAG: diaminopimelate aminotransferase [Deltaproteobacteria bacterium HGW-Deltaproteobacteria-12]|jgi:succinyl-diaminopimelate desuccinylase|nr:MAG: diaminopimelate aminotransferase [Deltaproteobacteria bacterium HGW-Deltaproteobacteria-12]
MMNNNLFKRVTDRIDSYRDAMIELQIGLCAIPAIGPENGGDGELLKADFLKKRLIDLGFKNFQHYNAQDQRVTSGTRPNFVTIIEGQNKSRFVWIITHLDIVPPGEIKLWSHDPYSAYVKNGHLFGRGAEDNQQDMVASIFAAKAILDEGLTTPNSIGLGFIADEETSGRTGLHHVMAVNDKLFGHDDLIIIPDSGNSQGSLIEIAEKSMLWMKIKTTGKQCHASKPQLGNNAFVAASHLVTRLSELKKLFPKSNPLYDPPASTFEATKKEPNVGNVNTIPGEDIFYIDCRVLPDYRLDDVVEAINLIAGKIENKFQVNIEISPVFYLQSPPPTPPDSPVVIALQEAIRNVYNLKAFAGGVGAGTLASYFRRKGFPAAVWSKSSLNAHQPDESCPIDNMLGDAKVFAHIFLQN